MVRIPCNPYMAQVNLVTTQLGTQHMLTIHTLIQSNPYNPRYHIQCQNFKEAWLHSTRQSL